MTRAQQRPELAVGWLGHVHDVALCCATIRRTHMQRVSACARLSAAQVARSFPHACDCGQRRTWPHGDAPSVRASSSVATATAHARRAAGIRCRLLAPPGRPGEARGVDKQFSARRCQPTVCAGRRTGLAHRSHVVCRCVRTSLAQLSQPAARTLRRGPQGSSAHPPLLSLQPPSASPLQRLQHRPCTCRCPRAAPPDVCPPVQRLSNPMAPPDIPRP